MKMLKPWHEYNHMAFDIDGTLLNSNIAHVWAWQDAIEGENLFFPHLTLFVQMGLPGHKIIEKFSYALRDKSTAERIAKAASEIYASRYVDLVAPFDGVYTLLKKLHASGRKFYAVTSASQTEASAMLKRFKLETYFKLVMTAEDSGEGKPSADPFVRLKEKIGAHADILSFGDSSFDLKASHEAGLPFAYLGHGGQPREWFGRAEFRFFNVKALLNSLPKVSQRARPQSQRRSKSRRVA